MADNITAPAAGTNFATDEIGGTHYPRNKIGFGADGAYADVSTDNPFPVAIVSGGGSGGGTVGGATETTLAGLSGKLPASLGPKAVSTSLSIVPATSSDMATNAGFGAALAAVSFYPTTQPVSGNVGVTGSVAVTGQFYQATQPVSIAAPVAVTGTFFQATQPISAAALPLPSGAATAAKQDTLATAIAAVTAQLAPYTTYTAMTVGGATIAAGRAVQVVATVAGNVTLALSGGGTVTVPVNVGLTQLPFAVTAVTASTATASYGNLG